MPVLDKAGIIPFKARAWLDLSRRRDEGEMVDDKDVKKHRNDVARLLQLLSPEANFDLPEAIKAICSIHRSACRTGRLPKQFGVAMTKDVVIDRLRSAYKL